jgi:aminoglycoside phosphotransferase (APT) family kinase protein
MRVIPALELTAEPVALAPALSLRTFAERSGLRAVVIGHSKDPNAKLTIMLVDPVTAQPVLAVKAPTSDVAARAVAAEVRMLSALRDVCPASLATTVPRVVDVVDFDGRLALVATAVVGTPMTTCYMRWRHTARPAVVAGDFAAAGAWLSQLQRATAGDKHPLALGSGIAERLKVRFDDDAELELDLERLRMLGDRVATNTVRRTVVHGDFWMGNVVVSDGVASGVVDWEAGEMAGEPTRDLVRFALMYALYLDRATRAGRRVAGHSHLRARAWGAGVEYAIDGLGWFPDLFRRFLSDGLRRVGASARSWRDVALLGILEVAATTDDPVFGRRNLELFRRLWAKRPAA